MIFINEAGELIEEVMSVVGTDTIMSYYGVVNGTVDAPNDFVWFVFDQDYVVTRCK